MAVGKKVMELLFRVKSKEAKKDIKEVGDNLKKVGVGGKLAQGGLNLMGKGFNKIGVAIKAAGIGLFLTLLTQLTGLFAQNQKSADTFQRIMIKLKPVFDAVGKVIEFVASALETLIDLFTGAIGWIGSLIGVTNDATSASDNFADSLVEQRKKVQLLESELAMLQLQYQREAELMRQIRDDEMLSIDERIQANFELGKILEEQLRHERNIAAEFLQLAEMELSVNKDNIELQKAVMDQKVKLAEIDERITGQRSEQLVNLNSLEREREAQQKEASAKREEQLKKEAEMLQELIDLQNEDIKVTKEKFRTINEQFDNAEEQNQKQIDELNRQMNAELNAHKTKVNNAKENIQLKNEEVENFKQSNKDLIQSDIDRANSFKEIAKKELADIGQLSPFMNVETMEDFQKVQEKAMEEHAVKVQEFADQMGGSVEEVMDEDNFLGKFTFARQELLEEQEMLMLNFATARKNILKETEQTGDAIVEITEEQIQMSQESANKSISVVENASATELAIKEKYAKLISDTEQSLIDTTDTLQEQANDELFLHFETAQEKELRLATEKYDKLLGLAQNNVEQTKLLEEEKEEVLSEIRDREGKKIIQNSINLFNKLKKEKEKQDKLDKLAVENKKKMEIDAAKQTLSMGVALAKEGTAEYKVLASAETIISTFSAATKALDDVPSPFNFVQAGLIITAGLKNLKEIQKTKVPGGSSGQSMGNIDMGSGVNPDMGGDVPALPTFGAIGTDAPPIQAFVVESDVSNAQALQSELDLQGTL
jgi:hypothetical protein